VQEIVKQGIELEGYVQERDSISQNHSKFVHDSAVKLFSDKVFPKYYLDDGKPEFPSDPYDNLGELSKYIADVITRAIHECEHKGWIYSLIGCDPFSNTFASTHIHMSIKKQPTADDVISLRKKLYPMQSFICLLSQNSPIAGGVLRPVKDARLAYSSWSDLTKYDSTDPSHYLALAQGRKALTLEVRLPSSAPYYQVLSTAVFVKTICKLDELPFIPFERVEDTSYRVIRYGGQALVSIVSPEEVGYVGLKGKKYLLPIKDLFSLFLNDDQVKPVLKEVLSELSSGDRDKVKQFFKIIENGYTVSDYLIEIWNVTKHRKDIIEALGGVTEESYVKKKPFWQLLPNPSKFVLPNIESKITINELQELLKNWNLDIFSNHLNEKAVDHVLNTSIHSLRKNDVTKEVFKSLLKKEQVKVSSLSNLKDSGTTLLFLNDEKIIQYDKYSNNIKRGELYMYVIQLAKEEKLM